MRSWNLEFKQLAQQHRVTPESELVPSYASELENYFQIKVQDSARPHTTLWIPKLGVRVGVISWRVGKDQSTYKKSKGLKKEGEDYKVREERKMEEEERTRGRRNRKEERKEKKREEGRKERRQGRGGGRKGETKEGRTGERKGRRMGKGDEKRKPA